MTTTPKGLSPCHAPSPPGSILASSARTHSQCSALELITVLKVTLGHQRIDFPWEICRGSCSILGNNDLMLISHIFSWKWDPWSATRPHCVQLPHQQATLAVLYASSPLRLNHSRVPPESFYVHCIHDTHLGQCHRPASCWAYWQPVQRPHVCRRVVPSWGLLDGLRGLGLSPQSIGYWMA